MRGRALKAARVAALLPVLLLAACAAAGGPLILPPATGERAAVAPHPGPTVAGADGTPLALSQWEAAEPRAVILALHGFGDHASSTFARAAGAWAARGITTYAFDQRGFGRNPSRGVWPGAAALVADARTVAATVAARHPGLPLAVVGHSMGGGVALAAAADGRLPVQGLVLAAPAIWGGLALDPVHRAAAWLAAALVPERRFTGEGVVRIQASDNIEMLRALGRDPLYLGPPSAREILGLVRISDAAAEAAERVALPALLLLGEKDEIVPAPAVRAVFARTAGPRREIAYPQGWHMLFRDLQAARVWEDVAGWVLMLPPPPG